MNWLLASTVLAAALLQGSAELVKTIQDVIDRTRAGMTALPGGPSLDRP